MTGEQAPGTNLRRSHVNVFLSSGGQHVPLKINMGFAQVWRKKRLICRNVHFHHFDVKEFRATPICTTRQCKNAMLLQCI